MAIIDTVQLQTCVHYCDIRGSWKLYQKTSFLGETLKTAMFMNKSIKFCACTYENIFEQHITPKKNNNLTAVNREYFGCLLVITMHVLGSCEASAQYSPINFFCKPFPQQEFESPSLL